MNAGGLLKGRPTLSVRPSERRLRPRQRLDVRAGILTATGPKFAAEEVLVKGTLGEGSYGQVFEGALSRNGATERVVLKRVKTRVEGAEEMGQMELLLNVYASQKARGAIANFMGHIEVQPEESNYRLTPGLWLVWKYEGCRTLSYYLKRRDCLQALARDLAVPEKAVVATVMKQIFECLTALHNAGVVHRDVKPLNLILSEEERRFKLIDLGAAADLRNGTNYAPDESILDPSYCPPEQYCLPTSAPHLGRQLAPLKLAISPLLWSRHKPDCFDSYSTGLVLMQLAVPKLRSSSGLKAFSKALQACRCDLEAWRERERLSPAQTAMLDADDGAGWDLAQALLRPRKLEVLDNGGVEFTNEGSGARLRVFAALKHRFMKQAAVPGSQLADSIAWGGKEGTQDRQARSKETLTDAAVSIWKRAASKLFDLEAKIVTQADALEVQTTKVQKLQERIEQPQGRPRAELEAELAQEAGALSGMQAQLTSLTRDFTATSAAAQRTLKGLFGRRPAKPVVDVDAVPTAQLRPGYGASAGSSRSDMPPSMQRLEPDEAEPAPVKKPRASRKERVQPVKAAAPQEPSSEPESKSSGKGAGNFFAGAAVNGLYTGLKFTGLAVRVASGLAASISKDAEAAMARSRSAQQEQQQDNAEQAEPPKAASSSRPTRRASMAFMEMLRGAREPPIEAASTWGKVAPQFAGDRRFETVAEEQRRQMFDTYLEALAKVEESRAQRRRERAAADFKVLLRDLGMGASTEWRAVETQLHDLDMDTSGVLEQKERQRLFLEVRGELAAEQGFKTLLESAPEISAGTSWPLAKRQIWSDPRFDAVPEPKRKELFQEYRAVLGEVDAYNAANAAKQAAQERAAVAAQKAEATGMLGTLQDEQARLKAEYDRMETKLKEMEARLKSKEATMYESDGVAAKVARDRHGNFVFQFDKDRAASMGMNGSTNGKHRM